MPRESPRSEAYYDAFSDRGCVHRLACTVTRFDLDHMLVWWLGYQNGPSIPITRLGHHLVASAMHGVANIECS